MADDPSFAGSKAELRRQAEAVFALDATSKAAVDPPSPLREPPATPGAC